VRNRQVSLVAFLLIVIFLAIAVLSQRERQLKQIPFSELVARVESKEVRTLSISGSQIDGELTDGTKIRSIGKPTDFYLEKFANAGVVPDYEEEGDNVWLTGLLNGIPVVLMVVVLLMFMRQMQVGSGRAMSFGKARARVLTENGKKVTFSDVAGCDEAKQELEEIIAFLKDPRKFTRLGGRIPKGVLLAGSPGTGKTLLARAVAGEAGVPFFSISGSEFVEMFVGVGASRVRDLFEQAKKQSPCIIFIDEIDAVGRHRGLGMGGGHDEREQTLNQLLVEMDGFESSDSVILMAATNRPDVLDPALLRPGRFDRRVLVPAPDFKGRLGILQVHARRTPLEDSVDLERIARGTAGFSGADLENLINEAALLAARFNKKKVDQSDLEQAKDKVQMGSERRSLGLSDEQKRTTAYHEAGHAIVARLMPELDPVNKITIIPRSMALGLTQLLPEENQFNYTATRLTSTLAYMMGGRAAEDLIFHRFDTGASSDLRRATRLATSMVTEYGMSETIGPVAWSENREDNYLGGELPRRREISEATAQRIDEEVRGLLVSAYSRAKTALENNMDLLHEVAKELLEKESLDSFEFEAVVSRFPPVSTERPVA
jgi:cell division protease FtsH